MKSVKIVLGQQPYTVNELPRKANAKWREQFQAQFTELAGAIATAAESDISNAGNIADLVRGLMAQINDAVEALLPLLSDYSPSVKADIARIEEDAFESELIDAFIEVLALAYPFGRAMQAMSRMNGLAAS